MFKFLIISATVTPSARLGVSAFGFTILLGTIFNHFEVQVSMLRIHFAGIPFMPALCAAFLGSKTLFKPLLIWKFDFMWAALSKTRNMYSFASLEARLSVCTLRRFGFRSS